MKLLEISLLALALVFASSLFAHGNQSNQENNVVVHSKEEVLRILQNGDLEY